MIARLPPDHPAWPTEFPEKLLPLRTEFETYYRELPRLLEDGEEGRYAIVKGDTVHSVWDTRTVTPDSAAANCSEWTNSWCRL